MMIDSLDAAEVVRAVRQDAVNEGRLEVIQDLEQLARVVTTPGTPAALRYIAAEFRKHYSLPASSD
jgi:hypothetical protein